MPRFAKGTIQLSPTEDIPLLRQILHSVYSTKDQLYEFMRLSGRERSRNALHNRLQRLVTHTLVRRHDGWRGFPQPLYSIGECGLEHLITQGELYAGRGCALDRPPSVAQHALDVNELHLSLLRSKQLHYWMPETEICSRNILTNYGFAKDYDAVVTIRQEDKNLTFALEYERLQKNDAEYQGITIALNRESYVDFILYLVTTRHLLTKVTTSLRHCAHTVAVGVANDFRQRLFDTPVVVANERGWTPTLKELLAIIYLRII